MIKRFFIGLAILLLFSSTAWPAIYYLDCDAMGANNGTSWANAWVSFQNISGLNDGDIVYISAGSSGTKSYTLDYFGSATVKKGSTTAITYKVGQDAGHNGGVAEFTITGGYFIYNPSHMIISGDAGDGLRHFAFVNNQNKFAISDTSGTLTDFSVEYVDFGEQTKFVRIQSGVDYRISHCRFYKLYDSGGITQVVSISGNASISNYDQILFHNNDMYAPCRIYSGSGDDFITSCSAGVSIYNNHFYEYDYPEYPVPGQHSDGIQPGSAKYLKIYNNIFENIGSYGIYLEAISTSTGYNHVRIFNNIFYHTASFTSGSTAAIVGGPKEDGKTYNDVVISNNIVVDYIGDGAGSAISMGDQYLNDILTDDGVFTDCYIVNNLSFNSGVIVQSDNDGGITLSNNVDTDTNYFVDYTEFAGGSNDYHITSSASEILIDEGYDLSFNATPEQTADKDGVYRPQGAAWDISAYEYTSGGDDVTAPTVDTLSIPESITYLNKFTVSWTCSDAVGVTGQKWRANAVPNASNGTALATSPETISGILVSGDNDIYVGCYDAAGNYGTAKIPALKYVPSTFYGVSLN